MGTIVSVSVVIARALCFARVPRPRPHSVLNPNNTFMDRLCIIILVATRVYNYNYIVCVHSCVIYRTVLCVGIVSC